MATKTQKEQLTDLAAVVIKHEETIKTYDKAIKILIAKVDRLESHWLIGRLIGTRK